MIKNNKNYIENNHEKNKQILVSFFVMLALALISVTGITPRVIHGM
ncbi:MAG TPA: hypothetical protein VE870_04605 [Bacteroidales bacterium]|nr:hypothetical protein [Bacteroidales bacterium]